MPVQKLQKTSVSVDESTLATFRVTIAKNTICKDTWEMTKRDPKQIALKTFGSEMVHSTYGWREVKVSSQRQDEADVLLQGFVRTKDTFTTRMLRLSGKSGLFVNRLTSQQDTPPHTWWLPREECEDPVTYFKRATEECTKENVGMSFRKGGGSFLGLRLPSNKRKPQLRAWSLHGAPRSWYSQDVLKCLIDSACQDVEILREPSSKQRFWLVKATVVDESDLGVLGIQAGTMMLYLNRFTSKIKRTEQVLTVVKPSNKVMAVQRPTASTSAQTPASGAQSGQPKKDKLKETEGGVTRTRSRSPKTSETRQAEVNEHCSKYNSLECGGSGNCGYNCIAAALSLDKGLSFDDVRATLPAKGRTVRNDIYKHMTKHKCEYEEWYTPELTGSREMEAGDVPQSFTEFLESTLRDHRWIDGLSLSAAARRYGLHIIVVPKVSSPKDVPMSFGTPKAGRAPVVLLLDNAEGHYTLAQLKPGRQWPKAWLAAEAATLTSPAFRGGGSDVASSRGWRLDSTPSQRAQSWRPDATPPASRASQGFTKATSKHVLTTNKRKAIQATKSVNSDAASSHGWRPAGTPSRPSTRSDCNKLRSQWNSPTGRCQQCNRQR